MKPRTKAKLTPVATLHRTSMSCRGRNGEPLLVVDRCCCFSLRTGALILASCEIIFLLAIVILNIVIQPNKEGAAVVVEGLLHIGVASVLIHGVRTDTPTRCEAAPLRQRKLLVDVKDAFLKLYVTMLYRHRREIRLQCDCI
ncbi:uncharacterized protein LOC119579675 [Penaeus monodon]|uniref:uncharacterized protein LOC119579675 n=1 Tax=Penaeus monodon TaxID=6687 RepID=UPI0018A7D374|nr:uncharacterized protein LOC119579675 [Penaeus monodon]